MTLAAIVLALLPAVQADPRARELVERLSDDSIEERQRAARELAELGPAVAPLLQELLQSADLELRARARAVLRSIDQHQVLRKFYRPGPKVTLEAADAPLADVLASLARQAGDEFRFDPAAFAQDRVTFQAKSLGAWEALDRLCRAAPALTYAFEDEALTFQRKARPPYPVRREGEFQVLLESIQFLRDYEFSGTVRESVVLALHTAWERGVAPAGVDPVITDVLDEKGQPIPQTPRGWAMPRVDSPKGRSKREEFRYLMPAGAAAPARLSRVKGFVTLSFPLAYEDAAISLDAPAPMTRVANFTVAVRNVRALPAGCALDLVVTYPTGEGGGSPDRLPAQSVFVVDDQGGEHKVTTTPRGTSFGGQSFTIQQSVSAALPEGRTAAKLRFRVLKEVLEKKIPFDFTDLPGE
jgi:hypothetical protein